MQKKARMGRARGKWSQQRNPDAIVSAKEREPNESTFISFNYMKVKKTKDVKIIKYCMKEEIKYCRRN